MDKLFEQENKNLNFNKILPGDMNNPPKLLNKRCLYWWLPWLINMTTDWSDDCDEWWLMILMTVTFIYHFMICRRMMIAKFHHFGVDFHRKFHKDKIMTPILTDSSITICNLYSTLQLQLWHSDYKTPQTHQFWD